MPEGWSVVRKSILAAATKQKLALDPHTGFTDPARLIVAEPLVQALLLDEVKRGNTLPLVWREIEIADAIVIRVTDDAIQIGVPGDSLRPAVSAITWACMLAELGLLANTARTFDAQWHAAEQRLEPIFVQDKEQRARADFEAMEIHSKTIDAKKASLEGDPFTRGIGKAWILSGMVRKALTKADYDRSVNYGFPTMKPVGPTGKMPWPAATKLGDRVWQPVADKHNPQHADYSQEDTTALHPYARVAGNEILIGSSAELQKAIGAPAYLSPSPNGCVAVAGKAPPPPPPEGVGWLRRLFPVALAATLVAMVVRWQRQQSG